MFSSLNSSNFFIYKTKKYKSIKKLISLLVVLFISCYALKSGVTIAANETFILGESNTKNYRAEIKNTSKFKIVIKGEKKTNWRIYSRS